MKILVLGGSGYVGRNLIPELISNGHQLRCLVRNTAIPINDKIEVIKGNATNKNNLIEAMDGIEIIYYLIHSMTSSNKSFSDVDMEIAENVSVIAKDQGIKRIIYLGALGEKGTSQSKHLKSRHQVGEILKKSTIPFTEFRAAVIVGNGSASFEMIKYLVNRLPVMICPKWVHVKTQPIFINDVIYYLSNCLLNSKTINKVIDIGGTDILSYLDMMKIVADEFGLKRLMISVPVLTPWLSSHWVNLFTPISSSLAGALIESVRNETIKENNIVDDLFDHKTISFREAVRFSLFENQI